MEVLRELLREFSADMELTEVMHQAASEINPTDLGSSMEAAVVYSCRRDFEKLRKMLADQNLEPEIALFCLNHLDLTDDSLDIQAFYAYEKKLGKVPRVPPEILNGLLSPKKHDKISSAGNRRLHESFDRSPKERENVKCWLLELGLRQDAVQWWSRLIPGMLHLLDSPDIKERARACDLVPLLPFERLLSSGLVPVFREAILPCIHFLPPSSQPTLTMQVHHHALKALSYLSNSPAELNELMRDGCIRAFGYTQGNFELTKYFLHMTTDLLSRLNSLVIIHLNDIVAIWMAIMADPFADASPELLQAAETFMCEVVRRSWPRIEQYSYDILFGLVKSGRMRNNPVLEVLQDACQLDQKQIEELTLRSDKIALESHV